MKSGDSPTSAKDRVREQRRRFNSERNAARKAWKRALERGEIEPDPDDPACRAAQQELAARAAAREQRRELAAARRVERRQERAAAKRQQEAEQRAARAARDEQLRQSLRPAATIDPPPSTVSATGDESGEHIVDESSRSQRRHLRLV